MRKNILLIAGLVVALVPAFSAQLAFGSDLAKEKRWADQIVDAIFDGEPVYLHDGTSDFLSIYTESEDTSKRGMIVAHGTGVHPDWEQVVQPVRVEMAGRGWNTLSIQMPILVNEATYEEYVPLYPAVPARLQAAEAFLKEKGMEEIVLVAHSQGASMSAYYLANTTHSTDAFVAIGVGATQADKHINAATSLRKITIPVFDLYGSDDLESVLVSVEARKDAAAGNKSYTSKVVDGANHFFDDHAEQLIDAIDEWLKSL